MTSATRAELETYGRELNWILDQARVCVDDLTPVQLNWRPATGTANSAWAIVTHLTASTRVYALGFGCGRPVTRDRPAEFAAAGRDPAVLVAGLARLAAELAEALGALTPGDLAQRVLPDQDLWGTGTAREISRRDALVESIRHAGVHLGELRLTRDLALRSA